MSKKIILVLVGIFVPVFTIWNVYDFCARGSRSTAFSIGTKKATALLQYARDTMPKITALMLQVRTASAAAANISDGYIHSVYDDGSPVKPKMKHVTESVQFKRWFGNWIENPEKASKTCL